MDHKKCSCSTGIHENPLADGSAELPWGLTFGQGKLDEHGYWEKPCFDCARRHEKQDGVPVNSYWPYDTRLAINSNKENQ